MIERRILYKVMKIVVLPPLIMKTLHNIKISEASRLILVA